MVGDIVLVGELLGLHVGNILESSVILVGVFGTIFVIGNTVIIGKSVGFIVGA